MAFASIVMVGSFIEFISEFDETNEETQEELESLKWPKGNTTHDQ